MLGRRSGGFGCEVWEVRFGFLIRLMRGIWMGLRFVVRGGVFALISCPNFVALMHLCIFHNVQDQ